jgi:hypothetical protein
MKRQKFELTISLKEGWQLNPETLQHYLEASGQVKVEKIAEVIG